MDHVKKYPNHTFNWIDLQSHDVEQAKKFYGDLFGWSAEDQPLPQGGAYTMFKLNDLDVAGGNIISPDLKDHPAFWSSYISTEDMDATVAAAEENGAKFMVKSMDVLDAGVMSVMQTPTGEFVSIWFAKGHIGSQLVNIPNTLIWNELMSHDVERSVDFYTKTFGWTVDKMDIGGMDYYVFMNGTRAAAGMMAHPVPEGQPAWIANFNCDDLDKAIEQITKNGGKIANGPAESSMGKFATVVDPDGAYFTIIQANSFDPMP